MGRSQFEKAGEAVWGKKLERLHLNQQSWTQWCMLIIPATQEA
jgi:hypothetical protein